jgi:TonB family protein
VNGTTTDVIVARSRSVDRLSTMLVWSIGAHIAVTAAILLVPHPAADLKPKDVMVISLGGAPGPRTGMTQMGARAVQAPQPEQPIKRPETAPAPARNEMALPDPRSKPQQRPKNAPKEATAKAPSTGAEPQEGTAKAETKVRGQGFGLSSGGSGGTGGVTVDAVDFCCPDYVTTMADIIRQGWNGKQGLAGVTTMMFTVHRNGRIEDVRVEKPSGFAVLDNEAARALRIARLPPLPSKYPNQSLTVHLEFEYLRQ